MGAYQQIACTEGPQILRLLSAKARFTGRIRQTSREVALVITAGISRAGSQMPEAGHFKLG
jgi:hypothetical protein